MIYIQHTGTGIIISIVLILFKYLPQIARFPALEVKTTDATLIYLGTCIIVPVSRTHSRRQPVTYSIMDSFTFSPGDSV